MLEDRTSHRKGAGRKELQQCRWFLRFYSMQAHKPFPIPLCLFYLWKKLIETIKNICVCKEFIARFMRISRAKENTWKEVTKVSQDLGQWSYSQYSLLAARRLYTFSSSSQQKHEVRLPSLFSNASSKKAVAEMNAKLICELLSTIWYEQNETILRKI